MHPALVSGHLTGCAAAAFKQTPPMPEPEASTLGLSERLRRFVGAWQPFTGSGLAAFADAPLGRVLAFQLVVAAGIGLLTVASLRLAWFPVLELAFPNLPESAPLLAGRLQWPDLAPRRLAENAWLGLVVEPTGVPGPDGLGQTADIQLQLRPVSIRVQGVFGHLEHNYPLGWRADLGRIPAMATWHAWRRPVMIGVGLSTSVALLVSWWILATVYLPFAWLFSLVIGRPVSASGSWKMASAALLVGAAIGSAGIAAYASGAIRMPGLLISQAIHIPAGWIWLIWGLLARTATASSPKKKGSENPFA